MAQPDFAALSAQAPVFAMAAPELQAAGAALAAAPMALVGPSIALSITPEAMWGMDDDAEELAEPRWPDQSQSDVADSVYRAARGALNQNQYTKAADLFGSIRRRYPKSTYVPNSYYWQAFALYRDGSEENLRTAREALKTQAKDYKKASTRRDADQLLTRIQGALARLGDEEAMRALNQDLDPIAPTPGVPGTPRTPKPGRAPRYSRRGDSCDDDDDDVRIAALNAVLQMDPDRAVPLLKTVLARRDTGSVCLRRKAVFLVSQKRTSETSAILLNAVRSDPDQEVREQAVFWLSQVPGDETVAALDSVLRDPNTDQEIQEKALFALSQHHSARAGAVLRDFAMRRDVDEDLREKAVFWIGQTRSPENAQFLKDLFAKADNQDLKEKILFSLSQMGGTDSYHWLMDVALNPKEDIDIRKKALFWAGQDRSVDIADLVRLYDSMNDREMREQLIFVYSQRREEPAVVKLCQIGKTDSDRELRKKAVFWLGQSRSATAGQCLQELINQ
jgi:HEAT repeat protein